MPLLQGEEEVSRAAPATLEQKTIVGKCCILALPLQNDDPNGGTLFRSVPLQEGGDKDKPTLSTILTDILVGWVIFGNISGKESFDYWCSRIRNRLL
jgi:hypothetical protein